MYILQAHATISGAKTLSLKLKLANYTVHQRQTSTNSIGGWSSESEIAENALRLLHALLATAADGAHARVSSGVRLIGLKLSNLEQSNSGGGGGGGGAEADSGGGGFGSSVVRGAAAAPASPKRTLLDTFVTQEESSSQSARSAFAADGASATAPASPSALAAAPSSSSSFSSMEWSCGSCTLANAASQRRYLDLLKDFLLLIP